MNVLAKTPSEVRSPASTPKITRLSAHIGAEVTGIDLREPVDEATRRRLNDALVEHIVMVIRDQDFTPAQFLAAASLFGEAETDTAQNRVVPELPVFQLSSRDKDKLGVRKRTGAFWHTDATQKVCPPNFTVLYPVELPASGGGDTFIANMRAGYEALPEDMKRRIAGMKTVNRLVGSVPARRPEIYGGTQDQADLQKTMTPAIHPLVRTHPVDKSKVLYFNPIKIENIVGMTPEDSHDLLDELLELAVRPEFVYQHKWRMGDMLIWDNRSSMHKAGHRKDGAVYGPNDHRTLNRITLKGGPTF
ncbi:MAG TPA: TauD/TfdA family dioxygenase [Dongiaceae bacterium]|nr:TauD/TfdA family dioxygenase [Dongiaceae bacterium]